MIIYNSTVRTIRLLKWISEICHEIFNRTEIVDSIISFNRIRAGIDPRIAMNLTSRYDEQIVSHGAMNLCDRIWVTLFLNWRWNQIFVLEELVRTAKPIKEDCLDDLLLDGTSKLCMDVVVPRLYSEVCLCTRDHGCQSERAHTGVSLAQIDEGLTNYV